MTNEAFARIKIDQLLKDTDWRLTDGISVRYEYPLDDGGRADYALFDRQGRALAVLEAKNTSVSLSAGVAQGRRYSDLLDVPFIFLSNGEEIWFCDMGVLGKPKFYIPSQPMPTSKPWLKSSARSGGKAILCARGYVSIMSCCARLCMANRPGPRSAQR